MDPHLLLFLVTLLRCRLGSSVASLSANVLWAGEAESLALVQPAGRDGPNYGRTESPRRSLPWTKVQTIRREHGRAGPLHRLPGRGSVTSEPSQPLSCSPQVPGARAGRPPRHQRQLPEMMAGSLSTQQDARCPEVLGVVAALLWSPQSSGTARQDLATTAAGAQASSGSR